MQRTPSQGLKGKRVLVVNSGGYKKRFTLERARQLGLKVVLVNASMDVPQGLCETFVQADTYNHKEVVDKLHRLFKADPECRPEGAITFWEDDVPLLGRLCEEFKLRGNSYETAILTRNKHAMRKRLKETGLGNPEFRLIQSRDDLLKAIEQVGFPAVLKPAWGADSEFVILVNTKEEAENTFGYLQNNCTERFNPIFKYNNGMFLYEQFMSGMEVSVECFSQFGIPHVVGINEKQPIKLPYFVEYGDIAPARLDEHTEQRVAKLAESALIALGVRDSLSHIELKITPEGPKVVEVGSRMGGDDIYYNVKAVWGVDLAQIGFQIALGMPVEYEPKPPRCCVVAKYFIPKHSGIVSSVQNIKTVSKADEIVEISISKKVGDPVLVPPEGFENAGWVAVKGKTYQEAETALDTINQEIEINVTKFHRDSFLGKTSRENPLSSASLVRSQIIDASRIARLQALREGALKDLRIGVLSTSDEHPVHDALKEMGYNVIHLAVTDVFTLLQKLQSAKLDFVMNLCEPLQSSPLLRSHVAALLEMMRLPFSGSGSSTVATALDKIVVKKLLDYHGTPTPQWDYMLDTEDELTEPLTFPLIVKPSNADNYFGIEASSVVTSHEALRKRVNFILQDIGRPALVEEYIEGDELDVCILGNGEEAEVLPIIRSVFTNMPKGYWHIYSGDLFRAENKSLLASIRMEKPAKINPKLNKLISEMALDMYRIFDCKDYAKIEMRIDKEGNPFVLEINPNPPVGEKDFFSIAAKTAGYSYGEILETILWTSVQRYKGYSIFPLEK